jgi:hypothetical protein
VRVAKGRQFGIEMEGRMRTVIKNDEIFHWVLDYSGKISEDSFPTVEEFQRDVELLKKDIEQLLPCCRSDSSSE